ncbi:hypothetical protein ACJJTC_003626 [Scirpophaga incertulas]
MRQRRSGAIWTEIGGCTSVAKVPDHTRRFRDPATDPVTFAHQVRIPSHPLTPISIRSLLTEEMVTSARHSNLAKKLSPAKYDVRLQLQLSLLCVPYLSKLTCYSRALAPLELARALLVEWPTCAAEPRPDPRQAPRLLQFTA